jgi:hypothetical protein
MTAERMPCVAPAGGMLPVRNHSSSDAAASASRPTRIIALTTNVATSRSVGSIFRIFWPYWIASSHFFEK